MPLQTTVQTLTARSAAKNQNAWKFLTDVPDCLRLILSLVKPYQLELRNGPEGPRFTGDNVAVELVAKMLESIESGLMDQTNDFGGTYRPVLKRVLENSLKREFAFRLKGLFHPVRPLTLSQVAFMNELLNPKNELLFGVGSTGTGKTHLSLAAGLNLLAEERVNHIVVTRPHVYLQGEEMTPEIRLDRKPGEQFSSIEDIFLDLISQDEIDDLIASHRLQFVPLGCMRGRTFNKSYIVIDEAQNMSVHRMRMTITRIGRESRMVVLGDPDQVDLHVEEPSGLTHLIDMIDGKGIGRVHYFQNDQIVRNQLVASLENLYSKDIVANQAETIITV